MNRYCIDLFSGAGGLSYGLSCAGFESLYACEINQTYANTYKKNHALVKVETNDIRKVDALEVMTSIGLKPFDLDLIAGGPPCQGFSINAPVRSNEDQRNHLFRDYLRFVEVFKPKAVLIENVPGLVSFENGATLHDILKSLEDLGYGANVRILGAAYYGVPQSRWRTIILALRGKELPSYAYPIPTNNAPIKPNFRVHYAGQSLLELPPQEVTTCFTTVEQAIGDLPKIEAGEKYQAGGQYPGAALSEYQRAMRKGSNGIWNHEAAGISNINKERFSFIKPGGNWTDIPIELLPKGMQRAKRSDHTKRYGRVKPDDLASTILTKCDPHWGAFIHYYQDRAFSVREAARIQSFPDTYIFTGTLSEQYAQVGNAVPPLLAKAVGLSLMNVLDREFVD
ncbi:DNA cytosine methyltransferase [Anaerobiospirillum sp. NML120448]|uniref:DNA cytosine methyltransferase n=1 Tax=Anaerobiospirillum sp. NML120448 TaxID=2932816 RepID=UPI001FF56BF5|nr:DNA cytosine methyltransferase [Anaerobiospirillum sp. NML120448]MCK0515353.1 DNA cytosine methyltransferase [Anaerobiospirillum sp. NML120448]